MTTSLFELQAKVTELEEVILSKHPRLPVLLRDIHTTLRAQPENVTLLSEKEIAAIVAGLRVQTGVELAASVSKTSATKSLKAKLAAGTLEL